jgi:phosphatidylserine decarboxylase
MFIHREGHVILLIVIVVLVVLNLVVHHFWGHNKGLMYVSYGLSAIIFLMFAQFFRNPTRQTEVNQHHVIAPADGKIVIIEEVEEPEYFKGRRLQVSIFMSPINVHVNRNPVSGIVSYFKYHPGDYLVAWHPKSSTLNELTTVVVRNEAGIEVLFRQIAGALARRICWYVKEGDSVKQGEEFGFIKFGSRIDVYLPPGTPVDVSIGQKVTGGETVLAHFN